MSRSLLLMLLHLFNYTFKRCSFSIIILSFCPYMLPNFENRSLRADFLPSVVGSHAFKTTG